MHSPQLLSVTPDLFARFFSFLGAQLGAHQGTQNENTPFLWVVYTSAKWCFPHQNNSYICLVLRHITAQWYFTPRTTAKSPAKWYLNGMVWYGLFSAHNRQSVENRQNVIGGYGRFVVVLIHITTYNNI